MIEIENLHSIKIFLNLEKGKSLHLNFLYLFLFSNILQQKRHYEKDRVAMQILEFWWLKTDVEENALGNTPFFQV